MLLNSNDKRVNIRANLRYIYILYSKLYYIKLEYYIKFPKKKATFDKQVANNKATKVLKKQ